ncbi:hypothetical protein VTK73DRAFT_836 [Phialemonium thermophilum]|uniref:DUF1993 domain-containing protein n=1 Tax=Phialemonium thermophilum TaxID=223376 RepID=A0ABR3XCD8_9PEZI
MAAIDLYRVGFVMLEKALTTGIDILQKAKAAPDASELPKARLAPDMFDLRGQVEVFHLTAAKLVYELGNPLSRKTPDPVTDMALWAVPQGEAATLDDLIAHLERARELVKGVPAADVEGKQDQRVQLDTALGSWDLSATEYVANFVVPNAFFHLQTSYAILRHRGVPLGKRDFLVPFIGPPAPQPSN